MLETCAHCGQPLLELVRTSEQLAPSRRPRRTCARCERLIQFEFAKFRLNQALQKARQAAQLAVEAAELVRRLQEDFQEEFPQ